MTGNIRKKPGKARKLYNATISYRTPAGRKVLYGGVVAAHDALECQSRLIDRLKSEERFGRRKISEIIYDFNGVVFSNQI